MKQHTERLKKTGRNGHKRYLRIIGKHWDVLRRRYKVKQIGIFGSVVRGKPTASSDIDIVVEYEQTPDLLEFIKLENYLESVLKTKVDLVEMHSVRPELQQSIFRQVVYL
jgi:predicted nucleotidyltransferase